MVKYMRKCVYYILDKGEEIKGFIHGKNISDCALVRQLCLWYEEKIEEDKLSGKAI